MTDPARAPDGYVYERSAIVLWLSRTATSPITRAPVAVEELKTARDVAERVADRDGADLSRFLEAVLFDDVLPRCRGDDDGLARTVLRMLLEAGDRRVSPRPSTHAAVCGTLRRFLETSCLDLLYGAVADEGFDHPLCAAYAAAVYEAKRSEPFEPKTMTGAGAALAIEDLPASFDGGDVLEAVNAAVDARRAMDAFAARARDDDDDDSDLADGVREALCECFAPVLRRSEGCRCRRLLVLKLLERTRGVGRVRLALKTRPLRTQAWVVDWLSDPSDIALNRVGYGC